MTQDLANLAPEHFEPLIGHTFTIGEHEVTLRDVHRRERTTARFREPFSLVFSLPHEVAISSEVLAGVASDDRPVRSSGDAGYRRSRRFRARNLLFVTSARVFVAQIDARRDVRARPANR